MSRLSPLRASAFAMVVLLLTACATSSTPAIPPATVKRPASQATPAPPTPTPHPFAELTEWDVVMLGDSSLWDVGEPYSKLVEQDRGVKVILHEEWQGGLGAGAILKALRGDFEHSAKRERWPQLIQDAEVLVLFGNPLFSDLEPALLTSLHNCIMSLSPAPEASGQPSGLDAGVCSAVGYEPYSRDVDAIFGEIARLRAGRPLILRAVDIYNPVISTWREKPLEAVCVACWDGMRAAIREAAEARGVPFVGVYDAFNGPNHSEDPRAKGYMKPDGEHPSEAGAQFYAELLRRSGYDTWVAGRP